MQRPDFAAVGSVIKKRVPFQRQPTQQLRRKDLFAFRATQKSSMRYLEIPQRTTHPNLYHWYILMKQFSLRTV